MATMAPLAGPVWLPLLCLLVVGTVVLPIDANLRRPKTVAANVPPEAWLSTPELVTMWGYPVETHSVNTDDGYILEVHRIPGPKGSGNAGSNKQPAASTTSSSSSSSSSRTSDTKGRTRPPVLLFAGFGATSECLVLRKNNALALMLADADYDVWLGNFRGSFYGRRHKTLRAADPKFWDFSFHENGVHDVAGTLDYVARATGQDSVLYVGHSMGGTALLALLAERPQYNARVRAAFLLAPAAYFHYVRGSFKQTRRRMRWGYRALAPMRLENPFTRRPYPDLCFPNGSYNMSAACWKFVTDAQGPFHSVKNNTYMPILMRHYPGGSSIGQLVHFGQLIIRGDGFYKYDYGVERNLELYGTVYPPAYNLTNVQTPMFIFYCKNDYQAHYKDVKKLAADLPGLAGIFLTPAETFNHLDIMYEEAAADLVYRRLIDQMTKYR